MVQAGILSPDSPVASPWAGCGLCWRYHSSPSGSLPYCLPCSHNHSLPSPPWALGWEPRPVSSPKGLHCALWCPYTLPGILQMLGHSEKVKVAQSRSTLCDPMDCSLPGSSAHGILQARILEWVAMPFSKGSFPPRDGTCISGVFCLRRQILYH